MSSELNLFERIKGPTPKFFKRVIAYSLSLAGAGTALLGAGALVPGFTLPDMLHTAAQWSIVAGSVAASISKTTINTTSDIPSEPKKD